MGRQARLPQLSTRAGAQAVAGDSQRALSLVPNQSATDIVNRVLSEYGLSHFRARGRVRAISASIACNIAKAISISSRACSSRKACSTISVSITRTTISFWSTASAGPLRSTSESDLGVGPHKWITDWSQQFRTVPQGVTFRGGTSSRRASLRRRCRPKKLSYVSEAKIEGYPRTPWTRRARNFSPTK